MATTPLSWVIDGGGPLIFSRQATLPGAAAPTFLEKLSANGTRPLCDSPVAYSWVVWLAGTSAGIATLHFCEKCEAAHTSPPINPSKIGIRTGTKTGYSNRRQEGYMAPKPKPATVGMVLAMAVTIIAAMTWAVAQPSMSLIYHPQLPLLY